MDVTERSIFSVEKRAEHKVSRVVAVLFHIYEIISGPLDSSNHRLPIQLYYHRGPRRVGRYLLKVPPIIKDTFGLVPFLVAFVFL